MERCRIAAGFTEAEAGIRTGRTATQVRRWEKGQAMPPKHILLTLAREYGVTPEELID